MERITNIIGIICAVIIVLATLVPALVYHVIAVYGLFGLAAQLIQWIIAIWH